MGGVIVYGGINGVTTLFQGNVISGVCLIVINLYCGYVINRSLKTIKAQENQNEQ